jgi:hypothetical protein
MSPWTFSLILSLLLSGGSTAQPGRVFSRLSTPPAVQSGVGHYSFANQRVLYRTYSNARYAFSIAYPVGVLIPQGEPDNGDGQTFVSRNGRATMWAYGANSLDKSLQEEFQSAQENIAVTYKVLQGNWFVVSGTKNGKIFYRKTLMRNEVFKTFIIEYEEPERATYDPITARIARSFAG